MRTISLLVLTLILLVGCQQEPVQPQAQLVSFQDEKSAEAYRAKLLATTYLWQNFPDWKWGEAVDAKFVADDQWFPDKPGYWVVTFIKRGQKHYVVVDVLTGRVCPALIER